MRVRVDFQSMLVFAFVVIVVLPALLPQDTPISSTNVLSVQTAPLSDNPNLPQTPQAGTIPAAEQRASSAIHWNSFVGGLLIAAVVGFVVAQVWSGETHQRGRADHDRAA